MFQYLKCLPEVPLNPNVICLHHTWPASWSDSHLVIQLVGWSVGQAVLSFVFDRLYAIYSKKNIPDMLEGLRWIQKDIAKFGGDPSQVTILGYSSSAGLISQVSLSPLSIGLFHRLIPISGTTFQLPLQNFDEVNKLIALGVGCAEESTWKAENFKLVLTSEDMARK